jgi:hypothetical protein
MRKMADAIAKIVELWLTMVDFSFISPPSQVPF